jgi:hypothetical protein
MSAINPYLHSCRADISEWLIHWTRPTAENGISCSAFERLKRILRCGYLMSTFAPRISKAVGQLRNTIQGPASAVCFTDQPLWAFIQSCRVMPERYWPYAIAVPKDNLFLYGGRPVIYGDKSQLLRLSEEDKYLWVRYDPNESPPFNYSIDWTHEREWRTKVCSYHFLDWGLTPGEGVPLVLPPVLPDHRVSLPIVIVKTSEEAFQLKSWLGAFPPYVGNNGFVKKLYENSRNLRILAVNMIANRGFADENRWGRLETLPEQA